MPTPTLAWVFNNGDLPSGINQFNHKGESFLEFLSVTKGMEGTYKCKARNKANTTSSSATLRVYGKFNDNNDDDDADTEPMLTMRVTNVDQYFNQLPFS